jgi:hypothetical protein
VVEETRDRYGPPPPSIENLAEYAYIRLLADRAGLESIDREGQLVVLKFRPEAKLDPAWLFKLVQDRKDLLLTPPATLRLDLRVDPGSNRADTGPKKPGLQGASAAAKDGRKADRSGPSNQRSWWTARATAGEVTSGFTKDEILRPAAEDPRAHGGVFSRVSGLLRDLLKY